MIQPLRKGKAIWHVYWVDLEDPVTWGEQLALPTVVIICDESGRSLEEPEVFPELDQPRVEEFLGRLFDRYGLPDRIEVAQNEDWDVQGWKRFSSDYRVEVRFGQQLAPDNASLKEAGKLLASKLTGAGPPVGDDYEIASALVESALRSRSAGKKVALLRKALDHDENCSGALIELADLEFNQGKLRSSQKAYEKVIRKEAPRWNGQHPFWWEDRETRPLLRALYGHAMVHWQKGRLDAAATDLTRLLTLNPRDHQGVRFHLPMVHLLCEDYTSARAFFSRYQQEYPRDFYEPSFLFGWGFTCWSMDEEGQAKRHYRRAMAKNIYMAPLLLDLPLPPLDLWLPNDRADLQYANEFIDSYAVLWDRDAGAMRLVREVFEETKQVREKLIAHRRNLADFQDQRYDPDYQEKFKKLVAEDEQLVESAGA